MLLLIVRCTMRPVLMKHNMAATRSCGSFYRSGRPFPYGLKTGAEGYQNLTVETSAMFEPMHQIDVVTPSGSRLPSYAAAVPSLSLCLLLRDYSKTPILQSSYSIRSAPAPHPALKQLESSGSLSGCCEPAVETYSLLNWWENLPE